MTMERYKRCGHCGEVYLCLTSGTRGYSTNYKNPRHCEGCADVVNAAIIKVAIKFENVWRATEDVTLEQLQEWERVNIAEQRARGGLQVRRVGSPMFRVEGGRVTAEQRVEYVRGRDDFKHRYFQYRYYPGEEQHVVITEELEHNLATGETVPWRNL